MHLTPTEQKIYDVLADGFQHSADELIACLWDELQENPNGAVRAHVCDIRRKIGTHGLDIVGRGVNGKSTYRLVRHIGAGE